MVDELAWARRAGRSGLARSLRQEHDLSLEEIAADVGVSPSCVSRWERGKRRATGAAAARWADILRRLAGVP
jgi:transcriptional regulator with XRE-family HTH domain